MIGYIKTLIKTDDYEIMEINMRGKTHVAFTIDHQTFTLVNYGENAEERKFKAEMLSIALEKLKEK